MMRTKRGAKYAIEKMQTGLKEDGAQIGYMDVRTRDTRG